MIKLQIIVFVFNDQEQFLYFQTFQKKKKKKKKRNEEQEKKNIYANNDLILMYKVVILHILRCVLILYRLYQLNKNHTSRVGVCYF